MVALSALERALAEGWQRGLPVVPAPFAAIADRLSVGEQAVLDALAAMRGRGVLSRVGPVFRPRALGTSTLAAIAVPPERLDAVAAEVSRRPEVNHNYSRENAINLWFVVTAADEAQLRATLDGIARDCALPVLSLPLVESYHLDLGFGLDQPALQATGERPLRPAAEPVRSDAGASVDVRGPGEVRVPARDGARADPGGRGDRLGSPDDSRDGALVAAIQDGLALVSRPFREAGRGAGLDEAAVLARIGEWIADGTIRRLGLVLHHRPLGFAANAMVVWDVPDAEVTTAGIGLAREPAVTLAYRRERALPAWRHNLYCMIHGRDRIEVEAEVARIERRQGLGAFPREVLFSVTAYKQRGARYRFRDASATMYDLAEFPDG